MRASRSVHNWYEVSLGALGAGTAIWLALTTSAAAQTAQDPATTLQRPNTESANPTAPVLPPTGENLSQRLDRTDGVIKPPAVGPDMTVPPKDPAAGSNMPVIPPSQAPTNPPTQKQ
jgi:hypothetical protein